MIIQHPVKSKRHFQSHRKTKKIILSFTTNHDTIIIKENAKYSIQYSENEKGENPQNELIIQTGKHYYNLIIQPTINYEYYRSIGDSAFKGCISLTKIEIPNTYSSIGQSSFESCTALQTVVITKEAKNVKQNAFKGCSNLNSVSIPSIPGVEAGAFSECNKIEKINILGSGKVEGKPIAEIFPAAKESIKSVNIDPEVSSFENVPFSGLDQLEEVHYYGENDFSEQKLGAPETAKAVVSEDYKGEFGSDKLEKVPSKKYGDLIWNLNEETQTLEIVGFGKMEDSKDQNSPFADKQFVNLKISEGITSIGSYCFKGIKSLNTVTLPLSLTEIGDSAFTDSGLKVITYNGDSDFSSLLPNTIPQGVTIYVKEKLYPYDTFAGQKVTKIKENENEDKQPPSDDDNEEGGLSSGAIAGISIFVIVLVAAIAFCVYWFVLRKPTDVPSENVSDKIAEDNIEF